MSAVLTEPARTNPARFGADAEEQRHEKWAHVHVNWTATWVGALASFAGVLLFGLIGIAIGAHVLGPEQRVVDLKHLSVGALIFSVCGAFFSFAIGGWIAGKIAGILHAEPAMLHGAMAWLIAVPLLLLATAVGGGTLLGGWYAGLGGHANSAAPFARPELGANATPEEVAAYRAQLTTYNQNVTQWHDDTPRATRNSALGVFTALVLGLIGGVIGGWMASGEPMNFSHYRTRKTLYHQQL
jgi:hypothetical protein